MRSVAGMHLLAGSSPDPCGTLMRMGKDFCEACSRQPPLVHTASLPAHLPCSRYVGRRSHLQEGSDPQAGSLPSTPPPPYHLCYCRVGGPQRGHRQRAMPCSLFAH
jgi:hypothetical protein